MAWSLYLVPMVGVGSNLDPRRPKYFTDGSLSVGSWQAMDYGLEPVAFVAADVTVGDDAFLVAQADVIALPANLDALLTAGQVTAAQSKLEALNIPSGWVSTALSWRTVLRIVMSFFQFMQRFVAVRGNAARMFGGTVTLDTQIQQLSAAVQADLQTTATSLGLSTAGITGTTTIRVLLKVFADQWVTRQYVIGGVTI